MVKEKLPPPPLVDNMYFEYKAPEYHDRIMEITFSPLANNEWEGNVNWCGDDIKIKVDADGFIDRGTYFEKSYIKLWLPEQLRKKNAKANEYAPKQFNYDVTVIEKTKWRKWDVWVVQIEKHSSYSFRYYDAETGWLVGIEREKSLIDKQDLELVGNNVGL